MYKLTAIILFSAFLFLPIASQAGTPPGSVFLDGGNSKYALILCHGRGKYPTWKVVDPLRKAVHKKMGWHTLSLQMPAEDKNWKDYEDDFPAAYQSIKQAIRFLNKEKGVTHIYLMGHSMGSRMASAFLANHPDQPVNGLIVAGIRNNGGYPFNGKQNLEDVDIPVLDIWGNGGNGKDAHHAAKRASLVSVRYKQVVIDAANHKFDGHENEFVTEVIKWLSEQKQPI